MSAPSPTCAVMQNIAQYLNVHLANITTDAESPWTCVVNTACVRVNCSVDNMYYEVVAISPCDKTVQLMIGYTNGTSTYHNTIQRSGMFRLNDNELLNVLLQYDQHTYQMELVVSPFCARKCGKLIICTFVLTVKLVILALVLLCSLLSLIHIDKPISYCK